MKTESIIAPCSPLDVEKMQTWLEDMARAGYLLQKAKLFMNSFLFYRISPLNVRYRITPATSSAELWENAPGEAHKALSEEFGWEYVCSVSGLHIYRCYSDDVRELNTDPHMLEDTLRFLHRRIICSSLFIFLFPITYVALMWLFSRTHNFWQNMIRDVNLFYDVLPIVVLFFCARSIPRCIRLHKLYRQLSEGHLLTERKPWKPHAAFARLGSSLWMIMVIAFLVSSSMIRWSHVNQLRSQDLPEVGTPLPFVTVTDLSADCPEADLLCTNSGFWRSWDHLLSPVNYHWAEFTDVKMPDGNPGMVSIDLDYHQLRWTWLADQLAKEYVRNAEKNGTAAEVPEDLPLDFAYYYLDNQGMPGAVLREGTTVVRISFPRMDSDAPCLQFSHWIERMLPLLTSQ